MLDRHLSLILRKRDMPHINMPHINMPHIFTAYWPAWLVTLIGGGITLLNIPFMGFVMVVLVSLVWMVLVAKLANTVETSAVKMKAEGTSSQSSKSHLAEPVVRVTVADESLQLIMSDVDAVVDNEVEVVRDELTQVKELVSESIGTLNVSFSGLSKKQCSF